MLINKKQQQNNHKNKEKQTCIYKKIASTELLPIYENICNICSLNLVKTHWWELSEQSASFICVWSRI